MLVLKEVSLFYIMFGAFLPSFCYLKSGITTMHTFSSSFFTEFLMKKKIETKYCVVYIRVLKCSSLIARRLNA